MKNRIANLKNKENVDLNLFEQAFGEADEATLNSILTFIESGTTDSISGI